MARLTIAVSVLLFASTFASLANDNILCSNLESISVSAHQLEGLWLSLEYYKASQPSTDYCTLVDDKALSSNRVEAHTLIYSNGSLVANFTADFVADGNRWNFQFTNKQQQLLVASVDPQKYITEVVCDTPEDPSQSKVLYSTTFRRVGVILSEEIVNKLREDVKSLLGLQDLGNIYESPTYCEPKLD
ncbi:hypothetical protein B566_EDAN006136 [Ephemera danica]|nr:hypothetical protein B566_EDAN006136 [Ephemera danica]